MEESIGNGVADGNAADRRRGHVLGPPALRNRALLADTRARVTTELVSPARSRNLFLRYGGISQLPSRGHRRS